MKAALWFVAFLFATPAFATKMVRVPGGSYPSFYLIKVKNKILSKPSQKIHVDGFWIDATPVTRTEFQVFVKKHPEWRRSRAPSLFVDSHYLSDWLSNVNPGGLKGAPVVWVSWFAAKAYCESKGQELPTTDQWEYVAYDRGRNLAQKTNTILNWYATPSTSKPLTSVARTKPNGYEVYNIFGLIWEWTLDFNSSIVNDGDNQTFCGNASQNAVDPSNYVHFMRESFRSSLKANYTMSSLGFRCARSLEK